MNSYMNNFQSEKSMDGNTLEKAMNGQKAVDGSAPEKAVDGNDSTREGHGCMDGNTPEILKALDGNDNINGLERF